MYETIARAFHNSFICFPTTLYGKETYSLIFELMNRRSIEAVANTVFWCCTTWLIVTSFSIRSQEVQIINGQETINIIRDDFAVIALLLCVGICAIMFYLVIYSLLSIAKGKNRKNNIFFNVIFFIFSMMLYFIIENLIFASPYIRLPKTLILGINIFYFTTANTYAIAKLYILTERKQQRLAIEKKQYELTLLRNQLQPHFLFNALNNLLSMVDQQQSPILADSVERLSGLLRYVIVETSHGKVLIAKELEFIRNYTALQLLRFEKEEVDFTMSVIGNHFEQKIEIGILISFIENAFKYGVEPEAKSVITVEIDISKDYEIFFRVTNPIHPNLQQPQGIGSGILSVRERLQLVYPNSHTINISTNDNYIVELTILTL